MNDKTALRENLYQSVSHPDRYAIIISDIEGFKRLANDFCSDSVTAEKYIETAINERQYEILKYIAEQIITEKKISKDDITNLFDAGVQQASVRQSQEAINIIFDTFGPYVDKAKVTDIINNGLMTNVSKFTKDNIDLSFIDLLIEKGGDVNFIRDSDSGSSPRSFIEAMLCNKNLWAVKSIILRDDFDMSRHQPPKANYSLLNSVISHFSSYESQYLIKMMIDKGADVNYRGGHEGIHLQSPLGLAISMKNICAVHMLIEAGADIFMKDMSGNSAIDYIRRSSISKDFNYPEILTYINKVSDNAVDVNPTNSDKALLNALRKNSLQLVRKALKAGADPNTYSRPATGLIPALGYSILLGCDSEITKELLSAGADPNAPDVNGVLPQNMLAMALYSPNDIAVIFNVGTGRSFTYNGVKAQSRFSDIVVDDDCSQCDMLNNSILLSEKLVRTKEILEALLKSGGDPGLFTNNAYYSSLRYRGYSPPVSIENSLSINLLLNIMKCYGNIYWAEGNSEQRIDGYHEIMNNLIKCRRDITEICRMMLENGLDPNRKDMYGVTAIEIASQCNLNEILAMLFEAGGKPYIRDGMDPFFHLVPGDGAGSFNCYVYSDIRRGYRKMSNITPSSKPGIYAGERYMSDMEMKEKIELIKESVDLFAQHGFAPEKSVIEEELGRKSNSFILYQELPQLREYICTCAQRGRNKLSLKHEDVMSNTVSYLEPDFDI